MYKGGINQVLQYILIIPDGIKDASVAPKTIAVKPSHTASIASKL